MAGTKKARTVEFEGVEHTGASLEKMTTAAIAQLVMRMRGEAKPPKPATKARAMEIFWAAAETLPKAPRIEPQKPEAPQSNVETLDATTEVRGAEKEPSTKARKVKRYSTRIDGAERAAKVEAMTPQARNLAEAMSAAGRPLTLAECAELLDTKRSKNPSKVVTWYFAKVFRPAGILDEGRGSGVRL